MRNPISKTAAVVLLVAASALALSAVALAKVDSAASQTFPADREADARAIRREIERIFQAFIERIARPSWTPIIETGAVT